MQNSTTPQTPKKKPKTLKQLLENQPILPQLIEQIIPQQSHIIKINIDNQNTANFINNQSNNPIIDNIDFNQQTFGNVPIQQRQKQIHQKNMSKTFTNFRSNSLINIGANTHINSVNVNINGNNGSGKKKKNNSGNIEQPRNILTHQQTRHKKGKTIISSNLIITNKLNRQSKSIGSSALFHKQNSNQSSNMKKAGSSHKFRVSDTSAKKDKDKNSDNQKKSKSRRSTPTISGFHLNPNKPVPQQIMAYVKKKQDVEIVHHFEQYKKQFYTKSKILHDYIQSTDQPQKIRNQYLNQNDTHFRNGLQAIMLKLYRNGTIVPQSYTNLRQEAVQQIEKWVIGWIHRKIMYGKLEQDEENQVLMVQDSLKHLQQYRREINNENTSF